nr:immunoglobulin heavy chain junction region [Mus musculus]
QDADLTGTRTTLTTGA